MSQRKQLYLLIFILIGAFAFSPAQLRAQDDEVVYEEASGEEEYVDEETGEETGEEEATEEEATPTGETIPGPEFKPKVVRGSAVTLLNEGLLLVTGGRDEEGYATKFAALYDPNLEGEEGDFGELLATLALNKARAYHTSYLLADGRVLVSGGRDFDGAITVSAEIFDPKSRSFAAVSDMALPRAKHSYVEYSPGKVLVAGGKSDDGLVLEVETFDVDENKTTLGGSMQKGRISPVLIPVANGAKVIIAGGGRTTEIYNLSSTSSTLKGALNEGFSPTRGQLNGDGSIWLFDNKGAGFALAAPAYTTFAPLSAAQLKAAATLNMLAWDFKVAVDKKSGQVVAAGAAGEFAGEALTGALANARSLITPVLPTAASSGTIRPQVKWLANTIRYGLENSGTAEAAMREVALLRALKRLTNKEVQILEEAIEETIAENIRPEMIGEDDTPWFSTAVETTDWLVGQTSLRRLSEKSLPRLLMAPLRQLVGPDSQPTAKDVQGMVALLAKHKAFATYLEPILATLVAHIASADSTLLKGITLPETLAPFGRGEQKPAPMPYLLFTDEKILLEEGQEVALDMTAETVTGQEIALTADVVQLPENIGEFTEDGSFRASAIGAGPAVVSAGHLQSNMWISVVPSGVIAAEELALADSGSEEGSEEGTGEEEVVDEGTGEEEYVDEGTGEEETGDEGTGEEEYVDEEGTGEEEYVDEGTGEEEYTEEEYVDEGTGEEEYVDEGTGEEEYVDEGTGEEEYVDEGTGEEEYVDEGTGEEEYIDEGTGEEVVDEGTGEEVDEGTGEEPVATLKPGENNATAKPTLVATLIPTRRPVVVATLKPNIATLKPGLVTGVAVASGVAVAAGVKDVIVRAKSPSDTIKPLITAMNAKNLNGLKTHFDPDSWEYYGPLFKKNAALLQTMAKAIAQAKPSRTVSRAVAGDVIEYKGSAVVGGRTLRVRIIMSLGEDGKWRIVSM